MEFKTILFEEKDGIAYLYINMPPANKMVPDFLQEIVFAIRNCALKTSMEGIIVTGSGRHFSSGADIDKLMALVKSSPKDDLPPWYKNVKEAFDELYHFHKPVVGVINGMCVGSGFELALHTHVIIAESNARIGLPETTFGLLPGIHGTIRCIEKIGYKNAFEMILKGELLSAEDAIEKRIVDVMIPKKEGTIMAEKLIHFIVKENSIYEPKNVQILLKHYIRQNGGE